MKYPERIAVDLARVVSVQPGSTLFHGIVGVLAEVIERCAQEARQGGCDCSEAACAHDEAGEAIAARILALLEKEQPD